MIKTTTSLFSYFYTSLTAARVWWEAALKRKTCKVHINTAKPMDLK
jgi:hypothetical protein